MTKKDLEDKVEIDKLDYEEALISTRNEKKNKYLDALDNYNYFIQLIQKYYHDRLHYDLRYFKKGGNIIYTKHKRARIGFQSPKPKEEKDGNK